VNKVFETTPKSLDQASILKFSFKMLLHVAMLHTQQLTAAATQLLLPSDNIGMPGTT